MSGEVREVWGAYHERERLCPEGVRVVEIAHVHYGLVFVQKSRFRRCAVRDSKEAANGNVQSGNPTRTEQGRLRAEAQCLKT